MSGIQQGPLYSAGMHAPANNTCTIRGQQPAITTPHTATVVNPICARHSHNRYTGHPALLHQHS